MEKDFFKKTRSFNKNLVKRRQKLLEPFIKKYNKPILVHAIQKPEIFLRILEDGKLKIPSKHSSAKKTPLMEKFLKIDNCLYYSIGFMYNTAFHWKYNLIFDLDYLKELTYLNRSISFGIYRSIADYWYENDINYFNKISKINKTTKKVFEEYLTKEYAGKTRKIFQFWLIEEELYKAINNYKNKKELLKIINKIKKDALMKYPDSKKHASEIYKEDRAPEGIGKKDNDLLKNKNFLGFYINGKITNKIKTLLKQKYPDKIIFDGKKIKQISNLN